MGFKQFKIMIDPGHGKEDGEDGAVGSYSSEENLNLIYANDLFDYLICDERFLPIMTRESDVSVSLGKRVRMAKEYDVDMFVSIHCNASVSNKPNDTQVYYYDKTKDKPLADLIFAYADRVDGKTSRWSRTIFGDFYVLRNLKDEKFPAVLVEIAFLTNEEDEALLNDPDFQTRYTNAIYKGIKAFFNIK